MPAPAATKPESRSVSKATSSDQGEPFDLTRMATLGTLACMLAHEMNNLLTPVLNYAKLALDAPADSRLGRKAHENAVHSVRACHAMAESILGFAREEGGDASADVAACVEQALRCMPRELAKDGVSLETQVGGGACVAAPAVMLTQVLLNLILNAREAMPQGGELRISAERSTWNTGESTLQISVSDTGRGIASDELGRIFEPFVSAGARAESTGLGLAICRRLLEDAGGTISVESRVGEGSVFTIELPEAPAAQG